MCLLRMRDEVRAHLAARGAEVVEVGDLRAAGADDFLQKPFTVDRLIERVCDLLEIDKPVTA